MRLNYSSVFGDSIPVNSHLARPDVYTMFVLRCYVAIINIDRKTFTNVQFTVLRVLNIVFTNLIVIVVLVV